MEENKISWDKQLNFFGKNKIPCFFVIDFKAEKGEVFKIEELEKYRISFDFSSEKKENVKQLELFFEPISFETFNISFEIVYENLQQGNSFLTNLTFSTPLQPIDLKEIYQNTSAKYKILYKNDWVCFSPESFVKIYQNRIFSFPMKGTISAEIKNAQNILLNDKKEIAEHATIVDLLRNDLSQVAKNVEVTKYRYLEEISTKKGKILQTSSEISGMLPENWNENLGDILKKLLPAGSISGAPKKKTLEIIQKAENHQRNFYTGIAGFFNGEELNSCVLIRFIEKVGENYFYKSGAGITISSLAESEYNEIQQKIYLPF